MASSLTKSLCVAGLVKVRRRTAGEDENTLATRERRATRPLHVIDASQKAVAQNTEQNFAMIAENYIKSKDIERHDPQGWTSDCQLLE